jgi:3-methyladenine DNA glycosylase AlkD
MTFTEIIADIKARRNPAAIAGMARYGIGTMNAYGLSQPVLRDLAKQIGKNHTLATQLWESGIHDARHIAGMIDDPKLVTGEQMERWAADFASWDLCDGICSNLFRKTPHAHAKAREWTAREEEFLKRAGFSLIATLAVHEKKRDDADFAAYLAVIEREADDERNYVKKAVNWALRQIGKRSLSLRVEALACCARLLAHDAKAARWTARDAMRELIAQRTIDRIKR